jgi:hypothetical protein
VSFHTDAKSSGIDTVLNKRALYLEKYFLIGCTLASITRIFLKLHTWPSSCMLWKLCRFGSNRLKMKGSLLAVQSAFSENSRTIPVMEAEYSRERTFSK